MPVEVELKYHAVDDAPLRRLAAAARLGAMVLGTPRTTDEVDRYLDTPDGVLAGARWACRLRHRDGRTRLSLKGPPLRAATGGLHRRPELEGPADDTLDPSAWPGSEARALLEELGATRTLVERFRLRQRRTERAVMADEQTVGTLSLDVVQVEHEGRRLGTLHAVELELAPDGGADGEPHLAELGAALSAVPGLVPDERTKLEYALDLLPDR